MLLEFLRGLVGFLAGVASIGQMFTGIFMCKVIYENGSTNKVPSLPFLSGFVMATLFLQQGILAGESAMNFVSEFGIFMNIGYLTFYYIWSQKSVREKLLSDISKCLIGLAFAIIYANVENEAVVQYRFGFIVSVMMLSLIAAPLLSLPKIIETQSTEGLPYPMIVTGFVVSLLWFTYFLLMWNTVLMLQNAAAALLCGFQLSLFSIFPDKSQKPQNLSN